MAATDMRAVTQESLEEALQVLAAREPVYFDPGALEWICGIPPKSSIRTRFGAVTCLLMRSTDGVLICAHSCGGGVTAYLASGNVAQDNEGAFVDSSFLPPVQRNPDYEDDEDLEIERTPRTTKGQPTRIDLRGYFINHGDMMRLSNGLASNCFVTILSLSGNQLQDSEMSLLADAIGHNGCLKELNLSYNAIGVLGSTLLATAVTDHQHLRLLDLMHNRVGRDGVSPWLGRTLRSNRVLQEIKLTHNDIGDRKGTELVSALAPAPTSEEEQIKRLIARRRTEATAVYPMSKPLKPLAGIVPQNGVGDVQPLNTTLKTLLLGNTGISDEAAVQIGRALAANRTLTHLDISSNAFTSEGHTSIARGLERNVSLRYLNYTDNRMSELSGVTLVRALTSHPVLETMLFQDCVGGSTVAVAIADMLQATTTLCTLDVSHCALEPPGVLEFYKSLALNTSMRHLDMTCMGIKSDQVVSLLAKSLEQQPTLRVVNLSYNDITLRGCKSLKDAVTRVNARQERLILALEGNSGEKRQVGVQVTGGLRLPKPISYQPDL